MKKLLLPFLIFITSPIFSQLCSTSSSGACTSGTFNYPSNTQSIATNNNWTYIYYNSGAPACFDGGNYFYLNVENGYTYEWTSCSFIASGVTLGQQFDMKLTLVDNSNNLLCGSSGSSNSLCPNTPHLEWTANYTGTVKIYVHDEGTTSCGTTSGTCVGSNWSRLAWQRTGSPVSSSLPDLVIQNPVLTSGGIQVSSLPVNTNLNAACDVLNQGNGSTSGTSKVRFYLIPTSNSSCDVNGSITQTLGVKTVGTLNSGNSSPEDEDEVIDVNTTPGNYFVMFVADADDDESEGVTGEANNTTCIPIAITNGCTPVSITTQPFSQPITSGNAISFAVLVNTSTATAPISYQWFLDGNPINGATNSTYTTSAQYTSNNGDVYTCEITNCGGTVTSDDCIINVSAGCVPVSFSSSGQPNNQATNVGGNVTFSASPSGTNPFTYQWKKNGINIPGENDFDLDLIGVSLSDDGNLYSCYITNCSGNNTVLSNQAELTVTSSCLGVNITQQPSNDIVNVGQTAEFIVSTSGSTPISYEWYENGTFIGNSNPLQIPSVNLADNGNAYYCIVTNCSGNNSETTDIVNLTVNSLVVPPSEFVVRNMYTGYTSNSSPTNLVHGYTNQATSLVRICADGSDVTEIRYINNNPLLNNADISFEINSGSNNDDLYGKIEIISIDNSSNLLVIKFTHPEYLPLNPGNLWRNDFINIIDNSNNSFIHQIPIRIYRAPVLLVHGLNSDPSTFDIMASELFNSGNYTPTLLTLVDYESTNNQYFFINEQVIPQNIDATLKRLKNYDYSAGKVDVIGHSMGGVLARKYLQFPVPGYKFDIHKLITLNTPHFGSQWGDYTLDHPVFNNLNASIFLNQSSNALEDLAVNSSEMHSLNFVFINDHIVPSHSITSYISSNSITTSLSWLGLMLGVQFNNPGFIPGSFAYSIAQNNFLNNLFSNSNDFMVSTVSQEGGISSNAVTTFLNQDHSSTDNPNVIDTVKFLLAENPNDLNFSIDGYASTKLNYVSFKKEEENPLTLIDGSLTINSPMSYQYFNAGEDVLLNVSSTNGIQAMNFMGIHDRLVTARIDTSMTQGNFIYTIPEDAFQPIKIIVFGYNDDELVDFDTLTLGVNPKFSVDSLSFYSDTLYVPSNNVASITVKAYRSNGYSHLISNEPDINYYIENPNIISYHFGNLFKGKQIGRTSITAEYQGKSIQIPVVVYPGDTTITEIPPKPSKVLAIQEEIEAKDNLLNIYPNPNNGTFSISFTTNKKEEYELFIYNQIGEVVFNKEYIVQNSDFSNIISLESLSNGVYYIEAISKTDRKVAKLLISDK